MNKISKPIALIILDGYGLRDEVEGNAVKLANTPNMDALQKEFPFVSLGASGEHVGLPDGQMGNSEVGHLNIGAGRIVYQELTRISKAIKTGEFFENPALISAMHHVKKNNKKLHLLGLVSDGGVHSHSEHLYALLEMAKREGVDRTFVHAFLDGRDTPPDSGASYIQELIQEIQQIGSGQLATIQGRYYAMDRDRRWDRVEKAYRAIVYGEGIKTQDPVAAIRESYANAIYDEFLAQTVLVDDQQQPLGNVEDGDAIIFFNFRPDRGIQLTVAFTEDDFEHINRGPNKPKPYYVCMTEYSESIESEVAFETVNLTNTLGEVLERHQLKQLRIAETEKFKHVTSFFSGGREQEFDGETRILIDSPKVATYDLKPDMSAGEMTDVVCQEIASDKFDVIVLNYANADMVGHTGQLSAAIEAVEAVDQCLGRVVDAIKDWGGIALITADHGNADVMIAPDGGRHTAHTVNRVPFIVTAKDFKEQPLALREDGILADIAPTILHLLDIEKPAEMTGTSIIKK